MSTISSKASRIIEDAGIKESKRRGSHEQPLPPVSRPLQKTTGTDGHDATDAIRRKRLEHRRRLAARSGATTVSTVRRERSSESCRLCSAVNFRTCPDTGASLSRDRVRGGPRRSGRSRLPCPSCQTTPVRERWPLRPPVDSRLPTRGLVARGPARAFAFAIPTGR